MADQNDVLTESGVEPWTPEQQMQELKRRIGIILAAGLLSQEKPSFKPHPDDVIVTVPIKNGTTWLLHICHQIRMKGHEPDFEDQLDIMGWIEASPKVTSGKDTMAQEQPADPRIFVSHLQYSLVPEGGKRIYCFRDPKDAVISAYHFTDSHLALKGRVALPLFAHAHLQQVEKHMNDLLIWWEHRNDKNLLLLFFDDLKEDHEGCVRRIAKYMDVECTEDEIARVVHTTTHAEMSRHASKFSSRQHSSKFSKEFGEELVSEEEFVGRVRKGGGKSGEGKCLPPDVQQRIDQMWQTIVTSKLGFQNLKEMRDAFKKERHCF